MGVNAQFISNNEIQVRTLGMIELKKRHTAEYLKTEVENILQSYGCKLVNVFCCTTDNGANMVKCINLLEENQENEMDVGLDNDDEIDENNIEKIKKVLQPTLRCVRCASHTLYI